MSRSRELDSMLGLALAALTAALLSRLCSAQTTVIGQFTGNTNAWDDSTTNPCIGTTNTDEVTAVDPKLPETIVNCIDSAWHLPVVTTSYRDLYGTLLA